MATIGQKYPPHTFTVERGKIMEFVQAIGSPGDIYLDPDKARANGYKDIPAPPTFGTVIDNWSGPDFFTRCQIMEVDPRKVLHAEMEYEYFGSIYPGDTLTAHGTITDVYEKEGKSGKMTFIVTDKVYMRGDEKVMIARTTIVVRG